jgi:molybdopterin biosynthesis enzyme
VALAPAGPAQNVRSTPPVAFPTTPAHLKQTVYGKKGWTDFIHARLERRNNQLWVQPASLKSALLSMAQKDAPIIIPEDREEIPAGETIDIQLLSQDSFLYLANQ